jgi:uncharacterized membrane protein YjjB (DUF3815 family)
MVSSGRITALKSRSLKGECGDMGVLLFLLGIVLCLVSAVCSIIILIDAFKNEIWKGVLYLVCGLYALYYTFAEFEHENKVAIILGALVGGIAGYALMMAGGAFFH